MYVVYIWANAQAPTNTQYWLYKIRCVYTMHKHTITIIVSWKCYKSCRREIKFITYSDLSCSYLNHRSVFPYFPLSSFHWIVRVNWKHLWTNGLDHTITVFAKRTELKWKRTKDEAEKKEKANGRMNGKKTFKWNHLHIHWMNEYDLRNGCSVMHITWWWINNKILAKWTSTKFTKLRTRKVDHFQMNMNAIIQTNRQITYTKLQRNALKMEITNSRK